VYHDAEFTIDRNLPSPQLIFYHVRGPTISLPPPLLSPSLFHFSIWIRPRLHLDPFPLPLPLSPPSLCSMAASDGRRSGAGWPMAGGSARRGVAGGRRRDRQRETGRAAGGAAGPAAGRAALRVRCSPSAPAVGRRGRPALVPRSVLFFFFSCKFFDALFFFSFFLFFFQIFLRSFFCLTFFYNSIFSF